MWCALPAQGKLVLQQVTYRPCIARLPCNFLQSEVSIHATRNNLICLNVGGKTRNIPFQLVLRNKLQVFVARFTIALCLRHSQLLKPSLIDSFFNRTQKIITEIMGISLSR